MNVAITEKLFLLIGKKIRNYRLNAKMNQTHLASQLGLSRTSLVNIEKGAQQPSLVLLWKFANAFNVEIADLIPSRCEFENVDEIMWKGTNSNSINKPESFNRLADFIKQIKDRKDEVL